MGRAGVQRGPQDEPAATCDESIVASLKRAGDHTTSGTRRSPKTNACDMLLGDGGARRRPTRLGVTCLSSNERRARIF